MIGSSHVLCRAHKPAVCMTQLPLYFLSEEPLSGFSPKETLDWFASVDNEKAIADAYAIVSNHVGSLMHELHDFDPWSYEAYDAWWDVEQVIFLRILTMLRQENERGEARHVLDGVGQYAIAVPFMRRNGYRNGSGWWWRDEEP